MARAIKRKVVLDIIAEGKHCNANCPWLNSDSACALFGEVKWDEERKSNGWIRATSCIKAELKNKEILNVS